MTAKVEALVDAVRAVRALEAADKDEGRTEARAQALKDAHYLVKSLQSHMSARDIWLAGEQLKRREP